MPYVYLVLSVFTSASSTVLGKLFNRRFEERKDSSKLYNFLQLLSVLFCWGILYALDFSFKVDVLWYAVLFALCFTVYNVGVINALKYGSAMLTSLFVGLSLILTTVWGFVFWNAAASVSVILGIILVGVAIYLCLYTKQKEEKPFSWKWLLYALLALTGNAGCTIVQRTEQVAYDGQHGNMLMFFASLLSAMTCTVIYLKSEKSVPKREIKRICLIPVFAGVCNVLLNIFVMLLATTDLSPSLIYPVIGVCGLGVVVVFSLFVFKEKMYWWQWLGIGIGAVAVALLSI